MSAGAQLGVCGLICLAIAVPGDLELPRGATVWAALVVTSLVASALGFFVYTYAQTRSHGADPGQRAGLRRAVRAAAGGRRAVGCSTHC